MGCNYYLYKKDNTPWILPVNRLGQYIERDIYKMGTGELDKSACVLDFDKCTVEQEGLHIGKSSCGWHFDLCIYPFINIYNLEDWKKLFNSHEYFIKDEYDEIISSDEMIKNITDRKGNSLLTEEELKENHADRGLNGLLAHSSSIWDTRNAEEWKQFIPMLVPHYRTDGPYDLTPDWDFS